MEHVSGDRVAVFYMDIGAPGQPVTLFTRRPRWKDGDALTEAERVELAEQVLAGLASLTDRPVVIDDQ